MNKNPKRNWPNALVESKGVGFRPPAGEAHIITA